MSVDPISAYAAIFLLAAVTLATRVGGAAVMRIVAISPRLTRFLEAMSSSVLAAIVVSFLAREGGRELVAVGVAVIAMLVTRKPVVAMVCAMLLAAGWTYLAA
ncbi:MAG: AzlD domain-containing protein [Pseudomonadota bacterium]